MIGASLSKPHYRRSTVKSVFLIAFFLDSSSLIMAESGLSAVKYTLEPLIIKSVLGSIVVIIPVCHTGDWGSIAVKQF